MQIVFARKSVSPASLVGAGFCCYCWTGDRRTLIRWRGWSVCDIFMNILLECFVCQFQSSSDELKLTHNNTGPLSVSNWLKIFRHFPRRCHETRWINFHSLEENFYLFYFIVWLSTTTIVTQMVYPKNARDPLAQHIAIRDFSRRNCTGIL